MSALLGQVKGLGKKAKAKKVRAVIKGCSSNLYVQLVPAAQVVGSFWKGSSTAGWFLQEQVFGSRSHVLRSSTVCHHAT